MALGQALSGDVQEVRLVEGRSEGRVQRSDAGALPPAFA